MASHLESLVNCSVCLEVFRSPKLLHCGHTFCLECIRHTAAAGCTTSVQCPICRVSTPLPSGQVSALTDDFRVGQLLEGLKGKGLEGCVEGQCKVCGKNASHALCSQCSIYMCRECLGKHKLKQDTQQHTILRVEDLEMCCIHQGPCSQICSDCRRFICTRCTLDSCLGHNSRDIGQAIRDHVGDNSRSIELSASFFKHTRDQQVELFDVAKKTLADHTDTLISQLLSRREQLEKELEGLKVNALASIDGEEDSHVSNLSVFFSVEASSLDAGIPGSLLKLLNSVETLPEGSRADVKFKPSADFQLGTLGTFVLGDQDVREAIHINDLRQNYGHQVDRNHEDVEKTSKGITAGPTTMTFGMSSAGGDSGAMKATGAGGFGTSCDGKIKQNDSGSLVGGTRSRIAAAFDFGSPLFPNDESPPDKARVVASQIKPVPFTFGKVESGAQARSTGRNAVHAARRRTRTTLTSKTVAQDAVKNPQARENANTSESPPKYSFGDLVVKSSDLKNDSGGASSKGKTAGYGHLAKEPNQAIFSTGIVPATNWTKSESAAGIMSANTGSGDRRGVLHMPDHEPKSLFSPGMDYSWVKKNESANTVAGVSGDIKFGDGSVLVPIKSKTLFMAPVKVHKLKATWQLRGEGILKIVVFKKSPWAQVVVCGENLPIGYMSHSITLWMQVMKVGSEANTRVVWYVDEPSWQKHHLERLSVLFGSECIANDFVLKFAKAKNYKTKMATAEFKKLRTTEFDAISCCQRSEMAVEGMKWCKQPCKLHLSHVDACQLCWGAVNFNDKSDGSRLVGPDAAAVADPDSSRDEQKLDVAALDLEPENEKPDAVATAGGQPDAELGFAGVSGDENGRMKIPDSDPESDGDLYEGDDSLTARGIDKEHVNEGPRPASPALAEAGSEESSHNATSSPNVAGVTAQSGHQFHPQDQYENASCRSLPEPSVRGMCDESAACHSLPEGMAQSHPPLPCPGSSLGMTILTHPCLLDQSVPLSDDSFNSCESSSPRGSPVKQTESTTTDTTQQPTPGVSSSSMNADESASLPFCSLPVMSAVVEVDGDSSAINSSCNADTSLLSRPGVTTSVIRASDPFPSVTVTNDNNSSDQTNQATSSNQESSSQWECQKCWALNSTDDSACDGCKTRKPANASLEDTPLSHSFDSGNGSAWECRFCWTRNNAEHDLCCICSTPKTFEGISRNGRAEFSLPKDN